MTGIQLVTLECKCCGEQLLVPWGIAQVGKIVEKVAIAVQVPWKECPTCGYTFDRIRFRSPEIGMRHDQANQKLMAEQHRRSTHPGLKR